MIACATGLKHLVVTVKVVGSKVTPPNCGKVLGMTPTELLIILSSGTLEQMCRPDVGALVLGASQWLSRITGDLSVRWLRWCG